jgi:molybdopterin synthase sulfur carrier subunit
LDVDHRDVAADLLREGVGDRVAATMAISIILPSALAQYARGRSAVRIDASVETVSGALAELATLWPAVTDRVLTEQGELRRHVNVFVGDESIRFMDGLSTRIADGEVVTIVPAVSGG